MNLYRETDIISEIRNGRLQWLGHVTRVTKERSVKKVFKSIPDEKSSVGKPRKRWMGNIDNDQKKMGVRGWKKR
jgi:hypothetical protein